MWVFVAGKKESFFLLVQYLIVLCFFAQHDVALLSVYCLWMVIWKIIFNLFLEHLLLVQIYEQLVTAYSCLPNINFTRTCHFPYFISVCSKKENKKTNFLNNFLCEWKDTIGENGMIMKKYLSKNIFWKKTALKQAFFCQIIKDSIAL